MARLLGIAVATATLSLASPIPPALKPPPFKPGKAPFTTLSNGVQMPLLAAGSFMYNSSTAEHSIKLAMEAGFNMVDTAFDYGNQDGVGRALKATMAKGVTRDQIFVETKVPGCGLGMKTVNPFNCYQSTRDILEQNLKLLDLPYVDLVITHMPPLPSMIFRSCVPHTGACHMEQAQWRAFEEFYQAGKARAIGVSNYCPSCFECLNGTAKVWPMVNQLQYHVGWMKDPLGALTYDRSIGVVTQAYATLGLDLAGVNDPSVTHNNISKAIAKAHNKSTVQVALKWISDRGVPLAVESNHLEHLKQDLDLFSWNMTKEETEALDNYLDGVRAPVPSFACTKWPGSSEVFV